MELNLTSEELSQLRVSQYETSDKVVFVKATCILMVADGVAIDTIANSLGVDVSTVYRYLKSYLSVGLKDFLGSNYVGYSGKLTEAEIVILIAELKSKLYTTAKSVSAFIYDTFGVKYSVSGTADLLYRIGFVFKKSTGVPCECDIEKQKKFVSKMSKIFKSQDGRYCNLLC